MAATRIQAFRTVANQDGAVILDTVRGQLHTLNSTGAVVWRGLEAGTPVDEIIQQISESTGAPSSVVERDVSRFIRELDESQLYCGMRGEQLR